MTQAKNEETASDEKNTMLLLVGFLYINSSL